MPPSLPRRRSSCSVASPFPAPPAPRPSPAAVAAANEDGDGGGGGGDGGLALFARLELLGALLRALALAWGAAQDALTPRVPYTDADYFVLQEGAALLARGRSPFERATFRYSPLLALLLAPGALPLPFDAARLWGKLLFCAGDLAAARLAFGLLRLRGLRARGAAWAAAALLLSPLAINVSSRGSADSLVCALVLLTLTLLLRRRELAAAAAFGAAVHLRLFPVVFAVPLVLFLDEHSAPAPSAGLAGRDAAPVAAAAASAAAPSIAPVAALLASLRALLSWRRVRFGLASAATFLALGLASRALGGPAYVQEALLFHFTRADTRHNFSASFYGLYLQSGAGAGAGMGVDMGGGVGVGAGAGAGAGADAARLAGLLAFLPQLGAALATGAILHRDLPFALFAQASCAPKVVSDCSAAAAAYSLLPEIPCPSPRRRRSASWPSTRS